MMSTDKILRVLLVLTSLLLVFLHCGIREGVAANQFTFDWHAYNYPNSCRGPGLHQEGQANFSVNEFPIPTFTVAGSLTMGIYGSFNQDYRAQFSGTLLRVGHNDLEFGYSLDGLPACHLSDDIVRLRGGGVDRLLFMIRSHNGVAEGATELDLSLREIDPVLADSLANLQRSIRETTAALRAQGTQADDTLARLEGLEDELEELIDRGLDEITPEELDAMLAQFDGMPPAVRDALVAYLRDLQGNVAELRAEIARVAEVFAQRADRVDGIGDGAPGFEPQNPSGFEPIVTATPPPIAIPEVLGDDPWSDAHDPYARYADEVLETLQATIEDNAVADRATFLQIHGAWVHNTAALENILQQRATVTVREWAAFLNAKGRVLQLLERFIDRDGWMRDAPASPEIRAVIAFWKDLDAAYRFKKRAEALQLEINLWRGELTERQNALLDIILLFGELTRERMAQPTPDETEDGFWNTVGNVVDTAISFTPVGDFMDLCRAITGRSQCVSGDALSAKDRAMHALGVVVGTGAAWKAAASVASGPAAGVLRRAGNALDEVPIRRPDVVNNANFAREIPHRGGAVTYVHVNGTQVRYNRRGFPEFEPFKYTGGAGKAKVEIQYTGNREADFRAANAKAGFHAGNPQPQGFTWHHHEDMRTMILVRTAVHQDFPHTGGFAVWQKLQEAQ